MSCVQNNLIIISDCLKHIIQLYFLIPLTKLVKDKFDNTPQLPQLPSIETRKLSEWGFLIKAEWHCFSISHENGWWHCKTAGSKSQFIVKLLWPAYDCSDWKECKCKFCVCTSCWLHSRREGFYLMASQKSILLVRCTSHKTLFLLFWISAALCISIQANNVWPRQHLRACNMCSWWLMVPRLLLSTNEITEEVKISFLLFVILFHLLQIFCGFTDQNW